METGRSVRQHMGAGEAVFHAAMIICTIGVWYPVYHWRKKSLARTVKHYT